MKILYVCTHNRCRSILSEAITNEVAGDRLQAYSAGSQPVGEVHPLSIKYLKERGISTEGLRSQSWNYFETIAPEIVVTVCDSAANETCPVWFGNTITLHWGLEDPSKLSGSEEEVKAAFEKTMDIIAARVGALLKIDFENLPSDELSEALAKIANVGA